MSRPIALLEPGAPLPSPRRVGPMGLVAVGGDLSAKTLLDAYSKGIFPWYEEEPILWFSPDPRVVLVPSAIRISRSTRRALKRNRFEVRLDTAFERVIRACAEVKRPGQRGTWINADMVRAYCRLHRMGYAHSAEAWREGKLAGGLYGVSLGAAFFGESMFARESGASKVALVRLAEQLCRWRFTLIDCQIPTEHLQRFGAVQWDRRRFLDELSSALRVQTRRGRWRLDPPETAGRAGRGV
ncbi:MAG: leucyl/phenylalanyl-tRNA--protein transferase [Acidobacteriota bacterium]